MRRGRQVIGALRACHRRRHSFSSRMPRRQCGGASLSASEAVRMEAVRVAFGSVVALAGVDFSVGRNEIVGLIGDNGAGKSTLIKVLSGVVRPTSGRLFIKGKGVDLDSWSVRRAHDLGIETVHQERSLGEKQPLWRNVFVGRQITNQW